MNNRDWKKIPYEFTERDNQIIGQLCCSSTGDNCHSLALSFLAQDDDSLPEFSQVFLNLFHKNTHMGHCRMDDQPLTFITQKSSSANGVKCKIKLERKVANWMKKIVRMAVKKYKNEHDESEYTFILIGQNEQNDNLSSPTSLNHHHNKSTKYSSYQAANTRFAFQNKNNNQQEEEEVLKLKRNVQILCDRVGELESVVVVQQRMIVNLERHANLLLDHMQLSVSNSDQQKSNSIITKRHDKSVIFKPQQQSHHYPRQEQNKNKTTKRRRRKRH